MARLIALRRKLASLRPIHWVVIGVSLAMLLAVTGVVLTVVAVLADGLGGSSRTLADFNDNAAARAFVSAHLPAPLPSSARVESLSYERFSDWHLSARVQFTPADAAALYLEQATLARKLNDAYCGTSEPSGGVRFFLADVMACGALHGAGSPGILDVACNTR